tara:strand:- start:96 stop:584 length:489 start_codon:yes stop_codon:yes gene_type:complete
MTKKQISSTENKAVNAIKKAASSLVAVTTTQIKYLRDSGIYKTPEIYGNAKTAAEKKLQESKAIHKLMKERCVTTGFISSSTLSDAMKKAGLKATKKKGGSAGKKKSGHVSATLTKLKGLVTPDSTVTGLSKDWAEFKDSDSNYHLMMQAIYKAEGWGKYEG